MAAARLCLNMIVRNEAAIIHRALESVADHIACWAISDTGSTDGTQALIAAFFAARGIPGGFCDSPFDTFEGARNRALDGARARPEAFDYILLMDADMQLRVEDTGFREGLDAPIYLLEQRSTISYWNARLLRRDVPSRYRGVTHEYLERSGGAARLAGAWFADAADGANRAGKFERDIALLLAGLEKEADNVRYVYYLAQSYRDAGQLAMAAQTYARRFALGGWDEERWSALLNEARCHLRLGDIDRFVETAGRAFAFRPQRAEPLYDLAHYHRTTGEYETAMLFCELAAQVPRPSQDRLFIEDRVYAFGIRQEISICGFYCASEEHRDLGRLACNELAIDPAVPAAVRTRARQNLVHYARTASDLLPSFAAAPIAWTPPFAGHATNPSIVNHDGAYRLVLRVVNFSTTNGIDYATPDGEPVMTRNLLLELDEALEPREAREILPPADFPEPRFLLVRGFEDLRLFVRGGRLWGIATLRERTPQGWCEMLVGELATDAEGALRLSRWRVLEPQAPRRHEKNWMPRAVGDRLEFVYSADPTRIVGDDGRTVRESKPPAALDHLRGGTQLVPFDGGWLALTHEVAVVAGARVYTHRFVWFDETDRLRRLSEPFHFDGRGIAFAAGLAWHNDGERLIVSYGVGDSTAWLATVLAAEVRIAVKGLAHRPGAVPAPVTIP